MLRWISLLLLTTLFAANAHAQSTTRLRTGTGSGVVVNAENMFRDSERQIIELSGNVQIIYDQQYISCDRATIDLARQEVVAAGNLVISSPQAYVEADQATISYRDNTGSFVNGFVKSGPVIFEGAVVRKTGPQTYDAEKASFTACTTCPTAWTFSGSRIQAEIGGYAYIKHAWLRVADVRTLWLPYLIVPLKSERQTGLLIPTFDAAGSGGLALGMNFFWAIDRSQDATFGAKYYSKRGLKGLFNYRYVLSEESEGELNFGLIQDKVFGDLSFDGQSMGEHQNRFFLNYLHSYDLPDGFNQKLKLNYVTDLLYPRDFPDEMPGRGEPALENRLTLTKNTERAHASLDTSYYINQLKTNPVASNRDAIQRWPEIRYALTERSITDSGTFSRFLFNFNFNYVNFARDGLAWDDVYVDGAGAKQIDTEQNQIGAGVFNPDVDVVRTGQRLDFQPELSAPFRVANVIDIMPTVQFRHTQYQLNVTAPGTTYDASPYRHFLRTSLSTRTRFSRIYGDRTPEAAAPRPSVTNWFDAESRGSNDVVPMPLPPAARTSLFRHEFEPEVVVSLVPYAEQTKDSSFLGTDTESLPVFLDNQPVSDSEFRTGRGLQFDYQDRFRNRNTTTLNLNNRLVRKSWKSDGAPIYKQIGSLRLSQSYDFEEDRRSPPPGERKFPYSDLSGLLDVRLDGFETNTLMRYFPTHNKTNTSSRVRVMDQVGRFLEMNFIQTFLITKNTDDATYGSRDETVGVSAGLNQKYFGFSGAIDFRPQEWWPVEMKTKSWSALLHLKPPGECWGILLSFRKDIAGETMYKVNFDYNFGGEKIASTQPVPTTNTNNRTY